MGSPTNLAIIVGYRENFFAITDREDQKPERPGDLPRYVNDKPRPERSGGGLCLWICTDDPTIASHAARMMIRDVGSYLDVHWVQAGLRYASGSTQKGETPRSLFGQKDDMVNPRTREEFDK